MTEPESPTPAQMPRHRVRVRNRDSAEPDDPDWHILAKAKQIRAENRRLRERLRHIEKLINQIRKEF